MSVLQIAGIALATVLILDRAVRIARHLRRIRELRKIEEEAAFNEHLMAAEWLILEVSERVDERGRFEWEA